MAMLTRRRLLGSLLGALAVTLVPSRVRSAPVAAGLIEARWTGPVEGMTATWMQYGRLVDVPGVAHPPDGWYHCAITDDLAGHRTYYINGRARADVIFPVPSLASVPVFAEFDRLLDAVTVQRLAESR